MESLDQANKNFTERNRRIIDKFNSGEEVLLRFSFPSNEVLATVNGILALSLGKMDLIFLLETIITILRECILNAIKANGKRLFFEMAGSKIDDPSTYDAVMEKFKTEIIGDFTKLKKDLIKSNYKVDFKLQKFEKGFRIRIENNAVILPKEEKRINERMTNARKFKDFSDAYEEMYDETEGAGLGIILTILLLKNLGVSPDNFTIKSQGDKTVTTLLIPYSLKTPETVSQIKEEILKEVNLLPTFPQNVMDLLAMCDNPDASIGMMSDKIKTDPSLTADILKLANSAGFISAKRIENINEALMRIGLTNLKYILIAASSRKIMDKRYKKFEQIWNHCYKVGFYARHLALALKKNSVAEASFISSVLHDLGKIVLLSVDLSLTHWIADFVKERGIRNTTILEEVSIGISHSSIGELIADKWNFGDFLKEGIAYHHSPLKASPENADIVSLTYLANMLCGIETRKYDYYYIDPVVMDSFNLKGEDDIKALHEKIRTAFENQAS